MSVIESLTRHKGVEQLQAELGVRKDFRRVLGLWQLTAIGLGGIIGVGIFVLAGQQAAANAMMSSYRRAPSPCPCCDAATTMRSTYRNCTWRCANQR